MGDLGVELHAVKMARRVGHGGNGRIGRLTTVLEARRQSGYPVPMAHPHVVLRIPVVHGIAEKGIRRDPRHPGVAKLALVRGLHRAAQLKRHGLHAVANAQHRHAQLKNDARRPRRFLQGHAFRPPGEDDAARRPVDDFRLGNIKGQNFAKDPELPHPARDELGVLRSKVEDQNPFLVNVVAHGGSRLALAGRVVRCFLGNAHPVHVAFRHAR